MIEGRNGELFDPVKSLGTIWSSQPCKYLVAILLGTHLLFIPVLKMSDVPLGAVVFAGKLAWQVYQYGWNIDLNASK
jgi:hypothetical protein